MKKQILLFLITSVFLINIHAQQSTTPTGVESVSTWNKPVNAALYYAGYFYIAENTVTGATINKYTTNGVWLEKLMDVPSKDSYPSHLKTRDSNNMLIVNNKLYFSAYVGGDETAILMYDLVSKTFDFQKRLSFEQGAIQSLVSYNGYMYITVSYLGSNYRVAQGANWGNLIDSYANSGNSETSIIQLDTTMNPTLIKHFMDSSHDYGSIDDGTLVSGNGFLVNFNNGRFERINLDGTTTHQKYIAEEARMKPGYDNNYIIVRKRYVELVDANWNTLKTTTRVAYENMNNVFVTSNEYIFTVGLSNDYISVDDGKQIWSFYHYDKDLNFKYKKSGVKLEDYPRLNPPVLNFQLFDLTASGYWRIGYYISVPRKTADNTIVQLAGQDLPTTSNNNPIAISYYNRTTVPTAQLSIQPASGLSVFMNKKLVNGNIVSADQFSAVIQTQNVNLDALVGTQLPASIASYTAPTGWSVWEDPSNSLQEYGKLYIQKVDGVYFVNIPMYDWADGGLWVNSDPVITNEVNVKVYLQNVVVADTDGDGVYDTNDLCSATPLGESVDTNGCSQSQLDDDNDGVMNNIDTCPNTATGETVDVNGCSVSQTDTDGDGVYDTNDLCSATPLGESVDTNGCSQSQLDDDNDGVMNNIDTCPNTATGETVDVNGCSQSQLDDDNDGVMNNIDTCPNTATGETVDVNGCSVSQTDTDGDGVYDNQDNCPSIANSDQADADADGIGDVCDEDSDNDGVLDVNDTCPNTPIGEGVDANGCSDSQNDFDGDGVPRSIDICPNTQAGEEVDEHGCALYQLDTDNDGFSDAIDQCIDTPGTVNGCPDTDEDGVADNNDTCSNTPAGEIADANGCSPSQLDTDGDGLTDDVDQCINTPTGETVDVNGCSDSQLDDDNDGVMNNIDTCPNTPTGETVDANGCSQSQLDDDNDGVMNNIDTCPNTPTGETVDANGCMLLASDNFTIEAISETCPNKNNGNIIINAQSSLNYKATINGAEYDFTTNLTVGNLSPGNYEVCIIVTNLTSSYCYKIVISEGTTISGKASVVSNKATIEITQGTPPYIVLINGKEQLQTVSSLFTVDVKHGDLIEIKTGVACEGIFSKTIDLFKVITMYPNPTSGIFEIALPMSLKEVKIALFTTNFQLISSKTYSVVNGKVQLNIENLPAAVYFAKVHLENPVTVKIIKQ
ncbi:hypothetical protein Lupro_08935 [Lutibacter profundi]|uniref:Secretion system C-terminal sorting domain-containing protein n=1 Tax=Lutibacter profundi TaxID=1622118 RepID=A0A0X8G7D4_9FLAO|nr:thrombospondin type 3 repeat-containing protein [Lutibacter profundi]AMC11376.1 hypothetical protein Lupro_08935 [Lutibacter profundi]